MHKLIFNLTNILFLFSALSFLCVYARPRNENFRPIGKNDISRYIKIKTKKCYHASICLHSGREICGKSSSDYSIRRFIDSCDMKEYNCLHKTDFRKTYKESCLQLPPIGVTEFYSENEPLHVDRDPNSVTEDSHEDASKDSHSKDNVISSQNDKSTEETEQIDDSTYDGREEKNKMSANGKKYVELNSDAEVKKYEADSSGGINTDNESGSTNLDDKPQKKAAIDAPKKNTDKIGTEESEDNSSNDKPDDQNEVVSYNESSKQSDNDSDIDQNDKLESNKVSEQSGKDSDKNDDIQTNLSSEQPGKDSDSYGNDRVQINRSSGKLKTKSDKKEYDRDAQSNHPRKSNNHYENHGF